MPDKTGRWSLIAHGGAKDISPGEEKFNRIDMEEAVRAGTAILQQGGTALDAVVEVVKILELSPAFNAGLYGSVKNEDGEIEMDASIMDGKDLKIGAVAGLKDVQHPILVARELLDDRTLLLAGEGAMRFAKEKNLVTGPPAEDAIKKSTSCDTVGCVALDQYGSLAVGTSTGGLDGKRVGRVGDAPLPGCGFYADNERGAVGASGDGEYIARVLLSYEALLRMKQSSPDDATQSALTLLKKVGGEAGLIAINPNGEIGWGHSSQHFTIGFARHDMDKPKVFLKKEEEHARVG